MLCCGLPLAKQVCFQLVCEVVVAGQLPQVRWLQAVPYTWSCGIKASVDVTLVRGKKVETREETLSSAGVTLRPVSRTAGMRI